MAVARADLADMRVARPDFSARNYWMWGQSLMIIEKLRGAFSARREFRPGMFRFGSNLMNFSKVARGASGLGRALGDFLSLSLSLSLSLEFANRQSQRE